MPAYLTISDDVLGQVDSELAKLSVLHRQPALRSGLRDAGRIVEKRYRELVPPPGYPGDKPGLKPLRDTITTRVAEYPSGVLVGVVGAQYPAGAHAHLLEEGFDLVRGGKKKTGGRVVGHVEGRHYLQQAVDSTKSLHDNAVIEGVRNAVQKTLASAEIRVG